jgi:hypothetical protein
MTKPRGADESFVRELQAAAFVLLDKHYKEINVPKVGPSSASYLQYRPSIFCPR